MPTFEIKHADGRTFRVKAPDQQAAADAIDEIPHGQPISQLGAFTEGVRSGVTAGFSDELAGLKAASGVPKGIRDLTDLSPMTLPASAATALIGGARLGYEKLTGQPGEATKGYEESRDEVRERQNAAREQFPKTNIAGQVLGSVALPVGGAAGAATLPMRIARGAGVGAGVGALSGAGEGEGAADTALRAGIGTVAGAALGAAGPPIAEGVGRLVSKVATPAVNMARSIFSPREEAARQVVTGVERDIVADPAATRRLTPEEWARAREQGQPVTVADMGGDLTRRLADVSSIVSPEGGTALRTAIDQRLESQSPRLADWMRGLVTRTGTEVAEPQPARFGQIIRDVAGGANATRDLEQLQQGARQANRPAYQRAYESGDREIWSPELERLTSAPSIRQAMQAAVNKWKDWQVVDGFGGANPGAMVERGMLRFNAGRTGVPTFPNLQFWDYTARNIADKAEAARRSGRTQLAAQLGGLERQIKTELDRIVPQYQAARQGAAAFFGANDALEAGRMFVRSNSNIGEARQALARMSAPERELFSRGYASEMADQVERAGDHGNLLGSSMFSSEAARQKNQLAMGAQRAERFEREIAPDRMFHTFEGATSPFEAGQNFVGASQRYGIPAARRAMSQMTPEQREAFQNGYVFRLVEKLGATGDRRSIVNQIAQSPAARAEIRMAIGPQRADELESRLRVEGIMDLLRNAVSGNSWTARRLYDVGLAGGAGLGLEGGVHSDPKDIAIGGVIAALSSGGKRVNANVMRHVAELLVSNDAGQLAKGVQIVARTPRLLEALRATDRRLAAIAGEQTPNLPAVQAGGISRAEGDEKQVPRPPAQ